jgi:hypothetical protein
MIEDLMHLEGSDADGHPDIKIRINIPTDLDRFVWSPRFRVQPL